MGDSAHEIAGPCDAIRAFLNEPAHFPEEPSRLRSVRVGSLFLDEGGSKPCGEGGTPEETIENPRIEILAFLRAQSDEAAGKGV